MKKILIANRGEIAVRIIRACHDLGLATVAVYSEADSESLHVLHADEAICIGKAPSAQSYLRIPQILAACEITGADAVHPGYGFLAENANFASICQSCGLGFIGPKPETIAMLGDKAQAKETAQRAGVPVVPGSKGVVSTQEEAIQATAEVGFPIFIKAVAGGGGRGIRIAYSEEDFFTQLASARAEAEAAFGNPDVYLEKMVVDPRHVEVQILADQHGNVVHLGERDCTTQRRRQKLIEECPSPALPEDVRKKICDCAVDLAKEAGYTSAGTVEFLVDPDLNFYFMEVNTRIQVEHTVSEELTGIDLVAMQLKVQMGEKLNFTQEEIKFDGHVMEFRINAENPRNNFSPSPGKLEYYLPPGGPHVRVDSACYNGYTIPPYYDSMIAKLIVRGDTREDVIKRARRALREFHISGVDSTIPFHLFMLDHERFHLADYDLNYIDRLVSDKELWSKLLPVK